MGGNKELVDNPGHVTKYGLEEILSVNSCNEVFYLLEVGALLKYHYTTRLTWNLKPMTLEGNK